MSLLTIFLPSLVGGGAERVVVNLLQGMNPAEIKVDLILASAIGPYLSDVPKWVNIIDLKTTRVINCIRPLCYYLLKHKPDSFMSHLSHCNVVSAISHMLVNSKTNLFLIEHNTVTAVRKNGIREKIVRLLMQFVYRRANKIVGVSKAVTLDLQQALNLPDDLVTTIYNPVINKDISIKKMMPVDHPWLSSTTLSVPVFLGIGRLTEQKDFSTLIKAFAIVRKKINARLLILGEGEQSAELTRLAQELNVSEDVNLAGFVDNPYAYLAKATAFVLSSRWEGLPTVLIEALGCGCQVISTDCPSGPVEILENGKFGTLVPMQNSELLANAMLAIANSTRDAVLTDRSIERANYFSFERSVANYLSLIQN
jgi:glycosyltransferase involved in cell wall biosynthesis